MNQDRPEITALDTSFIFEGANERIDAPLKKLLKFHVAPFEQTTQTDNFKTKPNGDANEDYGKEKPVLIFKAILDESDASGQWYSAWISGYYKNDKTTYPMSERSKLGKIAEAILGSADALKGLGPDALVGQCFQCSLKLNTKGDRQVLDIDKIMPAADGQTAPTADVVLDDIPVDEDATKAMIAAIDAVK